MALGLGTALGEGGEVGREGAPEDNGTAAVWQAAMRIRPDMAGTWRNATPQ
jgi:hypothetical protein